MVGPLTMKLDTPSCHCKISKQKLQGCKQPQAKILLNGVSAYNLFMMGPLTMKSTKVQTLGELCMRGTAN